MHAIAANCTHALAFNRGGVGTGTHMASGAELQFAVYCHWPSPDALPPPPVAPHTAAPANASAWVPPLAAWSSAESSKHGRSRDSMLAEGDTVPTMVGGSPTAAQVATGAVLTGLTITLTVPLLTDSVARPPTPTAATDTT